MSAEIENKAAQFDFFEYIAFFAVLRLRTDRLYI